MAAERTGDTLVERLRQRGVQVFLPDSVYIAPEVDLERIAPGVVLHPGCRIRGANTSIGPGSELGAEQPVTLVDCQLGRHVRLGGGFFAGSVFLDGVVFGSAGHVRPGCLLEEASSAGHAVGLKHTILMPWVTLGSLINLCDCLIAGGTSRHDHGEVGSSYIHFNFSAHGDKATPSMVGDVPQGVMLDQPPAFLGGQGGLVGPVKLAFGTVVAAGTILRRDVLAPNQLVGPGQSVGRQPTTRGGLAGGQAAGEGEGGQGEKYIRARYRDPLRIVRHNLIYIGNLRALASWYTHARAARLPADPWARACHTGALTVLELAVGERRQRLADFYDRLAVSHQSWQRRPEPGSEAIVAVHEALLRGWSRLGEALAEAPSDSVGAADRDAFLTALAGAPEELDWPATIQSLAPESRACGTRWLAAVVASVTDLLNLTWD